MTSPAVTIAPDETLGRAARLMYTRKVKRLPVVDASGHLVGIIGRSDLVSVFDRSDEDIRREIVDNVLLNELCVDPAAFTVVVKDGMVTVEGAAENRRLRAADRAEGQAHLGCGGHHVTTSITRRPLSPPSGTSTS